MNIAIDIPAGYPPAWKIASGALEYATSVNDVTILMPHAPTYQPEDNGPSGWDAAIVEIPRPELDLPQVCVSPAYAHEAVAVTIDQEEVVKLAVDQFESMGLRNMAYFGPVDWVMSELRWNFFCQQVVERGHDPVLIPAWEPMDALTHIAKPCGVMAFNDELAFLLLRICRKFGLRVPGDVHVISVDDTPACLESTPTLSSISMPFALLGFHAARLCAQMIDDTPAESLKLRPSGLIVRDSIKVESDDITSATEIAHYLRTHLSYPIQMEDVVRRSSVSRRQLEQVFRSAYGASPIAYLKGLRLNRAKELLHATDRRVKDIAEVCGYRDSNHLCRIFRESVGVSPRTYRQSNGRAACGLQKSDVRNQK